jgi:hypothetical protein
MYTRNKKEAKKMVETLNLIAVLISVGLGFYCFGVSKGFEDGKKYERRRIKKNEVKRQNF